MKTGDYKPSSYDIFCDINAPVLIIPEDIFVTNSNFIQVNVGKVNITSDLQIFDKDKAYAD
jgi:hypothetical protein